MIAARHVTPIYHCFLRRTGHNNLPHLRNLCTTFVRHADAFIDGTTFAITSLDYETSFPLMRLVAQYEDQS